VKIAQEHQSHQTPTATIFLAHSNRQAEGSQLLIKKRSKSGVEIVRGTIGNILSVSKSFSLNAVFVQKSPFAPSPNQQYEELV